jgi:type III pantothenate kinase
LCDWLRENRPALAIAAIPSENFPIAVLADNVQRIGADRLAAAVAANALRNPNQAAIIVDSGTAITVDAVDRQGRFLGGAIAPGWRMGAEALHRVADLLPLIEPVERRPPAVGKNTEAAIRSGLYWGAVGVVRELVARLQQEMNEQCDVFVTGGGASMLTEHLDRAVVHRDLVLAGVVLAGRRTATEFRTEIH